MPGKDFAVIGLGRFGSSICRTLRELGHDVLGIDESLARVQELRAYVTDAVQLDATDAEALRGIGITEYNAVVVAIGANQESSILVTLVLKDLGVRRVVAKANTTLQQRVLTKVGADLVVFPEADAGYHVAHSLIYPAISDFIELGEDYLILEVAVKPDWVGHSLAELGLAGQGRSRSRPGYEGLQAQIIRRGRRLICGPGGEERLAPGDVMVVVGTHEDLEGLMH